MAIDKNDEIMTKASELKQQNGHASLADALLGALDHALGGDELSSEAEIKQAALSKSSGRKETAKAMSETTMDYDASSDAIYEGEHK